nr:MAG TPA: hypothetical protein [Caudoviricetes sp.]
MSCCTIGFIPPLWLPPSASNNGLGILYFLRFFLLRFFAVVFFHTSRQSCKFFTGDVFLRRNRNRALCRSGAFYVVDNAHIVRFACNVHTLDVDGLPFAVPQCYRRAIRDREGLCCRFSLHPRDSTALLWHLLRHLLWLCHWCLHHGILLHLILIQLVLHHLILPQLCQLIRHRLSVVRVSVHSLSPFPVIHGYLVSAIPRIVPVSVLHAHDVSSQCENIRPLRMFVREICHAVAFRAFIRYYLTRETVIFQIRAPYAVCGWHIAHGVASQTDSGIYLSPVFSGSTADSAYHAVSNALAIGIRIVVNVWHTHLQKKNSLLFWYHCTIARESVLSVF